MDFSKDEYNGSGAHMSISKPDMRIAERKNHPVCWPMGGNCMFKAQAIPRLFRACPKASQKLVVLLAYSGHIATRRIAKPAMRSTVFDQDAFERIAVRLSTVLCSQQISKQIKPMRRIHPLCSAKKCASYATTADGFLAKVLSVFGQAASQERQPVWQ